VISVVQLGRVSYADGLRLQQRLVELRKNNEVGDVLLLLEHTPVITLGRNAKRANVLASDSLLQSRGVELFECDRGGDVTYHGPGQLVGYPIFDLRALRADFPQSAERGDDAPRLLGAVDFVRRLEEVLIRTCAEFAIATTRIKGLTGVWTDNAEGRTQNAESPGPQGTRRSGKIAAIGVHISRGVTSHGFALNVTDEPLRNFELIVPCGIGDRPVTSMESELRVGAGLRPAPGEPEARPHTMPSLDHIAQAVARNFGRVFLQQVLWVDTLDQLLGRTVGVPARAPANERKVAGEDEIFLA
jgi:lipoyl(octanoyl) transferase